MIADVGPALVRLEEVDDRVTADLLFPVGRDADVHRQRAFRAQELRRLEQGVELSLVVGDPAGVIPTVALGELEGRRLPQLERRGRLHVEVAVDHHGRRLGAVRVGGNVADHEIAFALAHELRLSAHALHEVAHPFGRAAHVVSVSGVSAHAGDRDELAQLVEPGLLHRAASLVGPGALAPHRDDRGAAPSPTLDLPRQSRRDEKRCRDRHD